MPTVANIKARKPHPLIAALLTPKSRECLKCGCKFESTDGSRLCEDCHEANAKEGIRIDRSGGGYHRGRKPGGLT